MPTETYYVTVTLEIEVPKVDASYLTGEAIDKGMQGCDDWDCFDVVASAIGNSRAQLADGSAIYVYDENGFLIREFGN